MSFSDMLADDLQNVFLNTSDFGETITYRPAGRNGRAITALVSHQSDMVSSDTIQQQVDRIEVVIAKSETVASGGIVSPKLQDAILWKDCWFNLERIIESDDNAWRLEFVRYTPIYEGRRQDAL